tara:strand:- start:203 stop:1234 length:1032 start_codon:yes stop_codon:yes gene_type:complete
MSLGKRIIESGADGITATDHFQTKLYTGTSPSSQSITGLAFEPSLVWTKNRDIGEPHMLYDSIRGVEQTIYSNTADSQFSDSGSLTSFNSDGFTLGSYTGTNRSGHNFVSWNWKGASSTATNNDGSVTSSVRANTEAGFSALTFTSPSSEQNFTIGHGLNAKPDMVFLRNFGSGGNWFVFHKGLSAEQNFLYLNENFNEAGLTQDSRIWGQQAFTSSVISTRSNYTVSNSSNVLAYCWHDVAGFQKFGSYTGNGSATGPTVTTGFAPSWLMLKSRDTTGTNWRIIDSTRDTSNPRANYINADTNGPEQTSFDQVNFLTDGFQLATTDTSINKLNDTILYWAIA